MASTGSLSDDQLARLDIATLVRDGLASSAEAAHRDLFGTGAVGAAVLLDRIGVVPRSLTFLAQIVRSGGVRYSARLAEPLPEDGQSEAIRPWLKQAATVATGVERDEDFARWLESVATIIAVRITSRGEQLPPRIGGSQS